MIDVVMDDTLVFVRGEVSTGRVSEMVRASTWRRMRRRRTSLSSRSGEAASTSLD